MKIHKGRICLMVISIAFLWLITGTAAAQYYIFSISFRENPYGVKRRLEIIGNMIEPRFSHHCCSQNVLLHFFVSHQPAISAV